MRAPILLVASLVAILPACTAGKPTSSATSTAATASDTFVESGFLTAEYGRLTKVKPDSSRRVYESPNHSLSEYDRIFIDRITLWRDTDDTEPVESADFQKVADDIYAAASQELGKTFELADAPGPGVARLRVALVAIDHPDDQLDVYVTEGAPSPSGSDEALPPGLREFGREAWVEAEMLDSVTKDVLFAVVDRAADVIPRAKPIETWRDLHEAFVAWADQAALRLTKLKEGRPQ